MGGTAVAPPATANSNRSMIREPASVCLSLGHGFGIWLRDLAAPSIDRLEDEFLGPRFYKAKARIGILRDFSCKKRKVVVRVRAVPGILQRARRVRYFVAQAVRRRQFDAFDRSALTQGFHHFRLPYDAGVGFAVPNALRGFPVMHRREPVTLRGLAGDAFAAVGDLRPDSVALEHLARIKLPSLTGFGSEVRTSLRTRSSIAATA